LKRDTRGIAGTEAELVFLASQPQAGRAFFDVGEIFRRQTFRKNLDRQVRVDLEDLSRGRNNFRHVQVMNAASQSVQIAQIDRVEHLHLGAQSGAVRAERVYGGTA